MMQNIMQYLAIIFLNMSKCDDSWKESIKQQAKVKLLKVAVKG